MDKYSELPEVVELAKFTIENDIHAGVAAELMDSLTWAGQAFQSLPVPPLTFWELVAKIATAGKAILQAEEGSL